jgi:choline transport protein
MPLSAYFAKVDDKMQIPVRAMFVSVGFCVVYGLLYFASSTAFNSIVTSAIIFLVSSPKYLLGTTRLNNHRTSRMRFLRRLSSSVVITSYLPVSSIWVFWVGSATRFPP